MSEFRKRLILLPPNKVYQMENKIENEMVTGFYRSL